MSDLRSIALKCSYESNHDSDILNSFYVPCLSESVSYDRMAGFFTSSSLSVAAKGIAEFIKNDGTMRIVASPYLSNEDADILSKFATDPDNLEEELSHVMDTVIDEEFIENENTEALGWLLLNGRLEIRLVVVLDSDNNLVPSNTLSSMGMFHQKVGIFRDSEDNVVAFSGSINPTANGWINNIESFDVFCSWTDYGRGYIAPKVENFEDYWELGRSNRTLTVELPDAIREKWIKNIPKDASQLAIFRKKGQRVVLRRYQEDAIEAWAKNGYRGIFNMATGTGKTFTAIYVVKQLVEKEKKRCTLVVAVPFQHLINDPWHESLSKVFELDSNEFGYVEAYGSTTAWMKEALELKQLYRLGDVKKLVIVTTYSTGSSEKFTDFIKKLPSGKLILIADEVHNSGSAVFRNGLLEEYDYRLGLSATPSRYLDDEGTNYIMDFFSKEVYEFSLKDAITKINPDTGQTYLTPYYYHPIFVSLDNDELEAYSKLSKQIASSCPDKDPTPQQIEIRNMLLIKRARIVKNAKNKLVELSKSIPRLKNEGFFNFALIYCSDGKDPDNNMMKTLNSVISMLNDNDISNRKFNSEESNSSRREILDSFTNREVSTLVAIKCLDEGVDVPATRNAIIMASSGNPREYIQRRGRVLRRSPGKEYATIYDFVVIPDGNQDYLDAQASVFASEYERFKEFAGIARNKDENYNTINKIISKYNLEVN